MLIVNTVHKNVPLVTYEKVAGELVFIENDDHAAILRLTEEANHFDSVGGNRLECFLILRDPTSLWLLQTEGLPEEVYNKVDVFATTMEDLLAKTLFVKLPNFPSKYPSLDRMSISLESESTVHLVMVGFSALTEALAINAALIAHYPNYCRDTRLRTRITIIDDNIFSGMDSLVRRYVHLFDNSYYRTIDMDDVNPKVSLHRPMYENTRKNFVDVEWEFVNGDLQNEAIRQKLTEWSTDKRQQLTITISHQEVERNYTESYGLPKAVYTHNIPVLCYTNDSEIFHFSKREGAYSSIYPFSYECCSLNTLRELKKLAQRVNYVYNHCFSIAPDKPITAPSSIDESILEKQWRGIGTLTKQYSNIFNAMTLGTKMHSIGHISEDWKEYYALTMEEINILTEVEHNRWCVEELILGYRPVNDEEQEQVEKNITLKKTLRNKKIHFDLRSFDDLRADSTGKNVNVYDMALSQGIPLIIKSCITN